MADDHAPDLERRHILLSGGSNFRDVGGYAAADGRTVRWGRIYRSAAMARLTAADWKWMSEQAVRTVCDLRSDQERLLAPTVWQGPADTRHVGPAYDSAQIFERMLHQQQREGLNAMGGRLYPEFPDMLAPHFSAMFAALLEGEAPLIVHCAAGQDRTGLAVGLILIALGVPRETIFKDYLLSTGLRRVENEIDHGALGDLAGENIVARYYTEAIRERGEAALKPRPLVDGEGRPHLVKALSAVEARWGTVEAYLGDRLGVGPQELTRLRDLYLAD